MKSKKHKSVKFNADEMAYDGPSNDEFRRSAAVGRGSVAIFAKPGPTVRLDADVAKVFCDSQSVNEALRKVIELKEIGSPKRKRSA